ncbi:MAG: hypothetical protein ABIA78_03915 [archaeon]
MGVLATTLIVLGILMLIEGSIAVFFPKVSLKFFRMFSKHIEKNIKSWGIGELIIAIVLIILGLRL